jgi:serine/threonine-protein kinase
MTPERYQRVIELFQAASDWSPDARPALLAEACDGDDELRHKVEAMLAADAQSDGFLDQPADDLAAAAVSARETKSLIGQKISHYEVISLLGAGGMGEVYRAKDARLNREVAIKFADESFSDRFEREARTISALNHPNICTLHDIGPNYLVMELVEGETLAELLKRGALPMEEALGIAKQIADALEAAHERGIIHRDLKPANIKIKPGGIVKVLDFGLAKTDQQMAPGSSPRTTRPGLILGTAAYMSPEQARGNPVDKRTDIWAFGVVLYEMLTGQRAFPGETTTDVLAAVVAKEPDWEQVPPKAGRLLRRCLEKDPTKRLRDISGVALLLEEPQTGSLRHSRLGWVAAVLAIIAMIAGAGWWRASRRVGRPLQSLARLNVDLGPDAIIGQFSTSVISPDGARLVFPIKGSDGMQMLAIRLLAETKPSLLPGTEDGRDPFFSPDGKWVGFFADGKMKKISVLGGAPILLCDAPVSRGASWGEDGSIVWASQNVIALSRVSAEGGASEPVTKVPGGTVSHRWPQVLPGGEAVLFTLSRSSLAFEDASIAAVSLKTGEIKILLHGGYFGRYLPTGDATGHLVYVHEGVLFGVRFDLGRLEILGTAVPLLEDLASDPNSGAGQFSFSGAPAGPGTFLYQTGKVSASSWPVWWLDNSGKTGPIIAKPGFYFGPRFSPDGQRLALTQIEGGKYEIVVYDFKREQMLQLAFNSNGQEISPPTWSPDGKHIVFRFVSARGVSIGWIRADGTGETQRLLDSSNFVTPSSFLPDGRRLVYTEFDPDSSSDLWTMALDLSDPDHPKPGKSELFLRTPSDERRPAFSPDGHWIAYQSDESRRYEVYVRPFPGPGGKWQISNAGGQLPVWSRNERKLFFQNLDNSIMVTDYEVSNGSFAPGKPRGLSDLHLQHIQGAPNYDLAPDGKRFAILPVRKPPSEANESLHVTFLLNFYDELRRRAPAGQ